MVEVNANPAAPEIGLINHYLKSMYFEAYESTPLKEERALPYDAQYNIVIDLLGRVFEAMPSDIIVKQREAEPNLFEVSLICQANSMCEESGKEMAVYDSQLIYAGLFRITGEMDSDMRQRCAAVLMPHMKNAVDKFISFSGVPQRFGWRMSLFS